MASNYPSAAENDPRAPWNEKPSPGWHNVYVTVELSVYVEDAEDAESAAWDEVEKIAKKERWDVVKAELQ